MFEVEEEFGDFEKERLTLFSGARPAWSVPSWADPCPQILTSVAERVVEDKHKHKRLLL